MPLEEQHTMAGQSDDLLSAIAAGAVGGFVATIPMTAAMQLMHERLPWWERYPLPPSQIISKITKEVGLRPHMDQSEHLAMTLLAHFAYGAAAGALYAPLADRIPLPAALKGILAGMVVWSTSYMGLLPALGILRPATKHPPRRNLLMIAAHVVWGAVLGVVADLTRSRQRTSC